MFISVITPSYNGGNYLSRAHQSLLRNYGKGVDFEWVIVDDYSNDDGETRKVIEGLCKTSRLKITPIFLDKNYYGSRSAYVGAKSASGLYSIILDQDDLLTDDALTNFKKNIDKYRDVTDFAGVCGRCMSLNGELIGSALLNRSIMCNEHEIRHVFKVRGEMLQCTKTSLLVEYFHGMKVGYTNGWAWSRIARKYKYIYVSDVVRVYDTTNPNSTSSSRRVIHLSAQYEQLNEYIAFNYRYFFKDPVIFLRHLSQLARISLHLKINKIDYFRGLPKSIRMFALIAYFVGWLRYLRDMQQGVK